MHINCIACGHRFDVGRAYDDYEGLVRCGTCRCLLDIRTQDGQMRGVRIGMLNTPVETPAPRVQTPSEQSSWGAGAQDQTPPLRVAA